jgi:hypothetical protein
MIGGWVSPGSLDADLMLNSPILSMLLSEQPTAAIGKHNVRQRQSENLFISLVAQENGGR